jgi:hypothetical protein
MFVKFIESFESIPGSDRVIVSFAELFYLRFKSLLVHDLRFAISPL